MRQAARANDANRLMLLVITFLSPGHLCPRSSRSLTADAADAFDKLLIAVTLVLAWIFGNAIYTLHYTHLYYSSDDGGKDMAGLEFPGNGESPTWPTSPISLSRSASRCRLPTSKSRRRTSAGS